jgi:tetratricopeptide (TPR) repeat protein
MSEEVFRTDRQSNRSVTWIAIAVAFLLVAFPVLRVYIPGPSWARWMLAYAANERVAGRIDNAISALDRSYQADAEIVHDSQYWQTRLEIAFGRSPIQEEEVQRLIDHAIETTQSFKDKNRRFTISKVLALTLLREKYWELATDLLDRTYKQDPSIVQNLQYWMIRLQVVFGRSPVLDEEVERVADHAIESLENSKDASQRSSISMALASNLLKKKRWDLSVKVLEQLLEPPQRRTSEQNNLIAYSRSLSNTGLDQALVEIDLAMKRDEDIPAYLDTKGWVLYQSGEYEEAILFANRAVAGFATEIQAVAPELYSLLTDKRAPADSDASSKIDKLLGEEEIDDAKANVDAAPSVDAPTTVQLAIVEMIKNYAVVRLHRARILEGLGRNEEANQDLEWIKSIGINDLSNLY